MKLKQTMIQLAVLSALGAGVANEASASVYGVSTVAITNLSVVVSPQAGASIRNFNYNLTNSAFLNGVGGASNGSCSGTPGSNNCGAAPALEAAVYNAPGSTIVAAENSFGLQGPGANQYSRADSVIYTSQLTSLGATLTSQQQIAESELQTGTSASATSTIQSVTGFTFSFTVTAPGSLTLSFDAAAYLEASSNDPLGINQAAQANIALVGTLQRDTTSGGGYLWQWTPDGTVNANCIAAGAGAGCTEASDAANIGSNSVGVTTDPATASFNAATGKYQVTFSGLQAGDHTFTLRSETSTNLSRTSVPEPAGLFLLGIGLLGMTFNMRRKGSSLAA